MESFYIYSSEVYDENYNVWSCLGHFPAKNDIEAKVLAEELSLEKLRSNGVKVLKLKKNVFISKVNTDDILLSKDIIDTTWAKKVDWATLEIHSAVLDGKLRDKVNYVMLILVEEAYNRGRLSVKNAT